MANRTGKIWTVEEIKDLVLNNDRAVVKGVVRIFELQTYTEQNSENTINHNGVGFGAFDAAFLSSLAKQVKNGRTLTDNQIKFARPKIAKYAKQLTRIANGEFNQMLQASAE